MKRLEIGIAAAMLALATVIVLNTAALTYQAAHVPGPGFMPVWVAVLAAVLALILLGKALVATGERPVSWPERDGGIRIALVYLSLWAVVLLAPVLGFVLSAALFVLFFLSAVMRKPLLAGLLTASFLAALVQAIFVAWLDVGLPRGILGI